MLQCEDIMDRQWQKYFQVFSVSRLCLDHQYSLESMKNECIQVD